MEKIKAVREALNLKQNEFAPRLNITQSYLSALETGKKAITNKVIAVLFDKFAVSPEWFYNNNGAIFNSSMGNMNGVMNGVNTSSTNTEEGYNENVNKFLYNGNYEQDRADFYYRHLDTRLNQILSVAINDFKQIFTDYSKLIRLSNDFGAPDFIKEKFEPGPKFNDYKKIINNEFKETHSHITDEKLLKCFQIIAYENETDHFRNAISQLINYMERYVDFFKGFIKKPAN